MLIIFLISLQGVRLNIRTIPGEIISSSIIKIEIFCSAYPLMLTKLMKIYVAFSIIICSSASQIREATNRSILMFIRTRAYTGYTSTE